MPTFVGAKKCVLRRSEEEHVMAGGEEADALRDKYEPELEMKPSSESHDCSFAGGDRGGRKMKALMGA